MPLDQPRGSDVSPHMHWYPGITFWQTAVDLVFANNVPSGHGPGWTTADTVRLRALLDARPR